MWKCAECEEDNDLDPDVEEGQILECTECGAEFEVSRVEPLAFSKLSSSAGDDAGTGDAGWDE